MGKPYAIPAKAIKVNFMTKSYRDSPLSTSQMGSMEVIYKQACSQTQSVYVFRYRLFFLTGPPLKSQVFETTESKNFLDFSALAFPPQTTESKNFLDCNFISTGPPPMK